MTILSTTSLSATSRKLRQTTLEGFTEAEAIGYILTYKLYFLFIHGL